MLGDILLAVSSFKHPSTVLDLCYLPAVGTRLNRPRPGICRQIVGLMDLSCTLLPIGALLGIRINTEFSLAIDMNQGLHCQKVAVIG